MGGGEEEAPQGSMLAPIMFPFFIDIQESLNNYINLFDDDAMLLRVIKSYDDCMELQGDIDKIWEWSQRCHAIEMGKSNIRHTWEYKKGE